MIYNQRHRKNLPRVLFIFPPFRANENRPMIPMDREIMGRILY